MLGDTTFVAFYLYRVYFAAGQFDGNGMAALVD